MSGNDPEQTSHASAKPLVRRFEVEPTLHQYRQPRSDAYDRSTRLLQLRAASPVERSLLPSSQIQLLQQPRTSMVIQPSIRSTTRCATSAPLSASETSSSL